MDLDSTSTTLLAKARAESPLAWQRLLDEYAPAVYAWCRLDGVSPDDAADITQDVLLTVYQRLDSFQKDAPGATFRGWLRRIARHQVVDHWRRAARRPCEAQGGTSVKQVLDQVEVEEVSNWTEPETCNEETLAVRIATDRVRDRCTARTWEIFSCYIADGLTAEEAAGAFGVSVGYVHQVRARVLRRYREELNRLQNEISTKPT